MSNEKLIVTFLTPKTPYKAGETAGIDADLAKEYEEKGIAKIGGKPIVSGVAQSIVPRGENIVGEKYLDGKIDIVIPTKDKTGETANALISYLNLATAQGADNINDITIVEREFNDENGGFAKACNDGAKLNEGKGEFILFLNDDVELGINFFDEILKPFENTKVAMAGTEASKKDWGVNGAVMCVRREIFEEVGGFDETYFFMWEDRDLCENLKNRGYEIEISKADAIHAGGASTKNNNFYKKHFAAGKKYFGEKWSKKKD